MIAERLRRHEKMGSTFQHSGLNDSRGTLVAFKVVFVRNMTKVSGRAACFSLLIIAVWRWQADILDGRGKKGGAQFSEVSCGAGAGAGGHVDTRVSV